MSRRKRERCGRARRPGEAVATSSARHAPLRAASPAPWSGSERVLPASGSQTAATGPENESLTREERILVQQSLTALGTDVGSADGVFGRRTRSAISEWQSANGLNATGHVTREQFASLTDGDVCPLRSDWKDTPNACPCEKDWVPTDRQVNVMVERHSKWLAATLRPNFSIPGRAVFCNSFFLNTHFPGARLNHADFRYADLFTGNLREQKHETPTTDLGIDFTGAELRHADLSGANITVGVFREANVSHANSRKRASVSW